MRPVPRQRHLAAALIFLAVAAGLASQAFFDGRLSASQMNISSAALKRHQPELFAHDPVFGAGELWRFHTPAFQAMLELVLVPTGYEDLFLPFRLLTAVVVLVYLGGMYALLYHQCKSWSVSAFVAVLSCRITWTLGWSFWGVGSLSSMTPSTVFAALTPLIVLSFLRYRSQWRILLVFAFIGICGNLHLVTAMNLTLILLGVYLGVRRFRPGCWPMALGCGACSLLGALPYASYYFAMRSRLGAGQSPALASAALEALRLANLEVLYPALFKPLLEWGPWLGVLAVPAILVLVRIERFRLRNGGVWFWFLICGIAVSFGLQGMSQLIGILRSKAPPVIDFANAASLLMLPLYVLLGQGLTNLFRLIRSKSLRSGLRWACALLCVVWLGPSDNLRYARHRAYDLATAFMDEQDKPRNIQRHLHQQRRGAELTQIAAWAQKNTQIGDVFLTDSIEFRMRARRSIVASSEDIKYVYYLAPWRLDEWMNRVGHLSSVLHLAGGKADPAALKQLVTELSGREEFAGATGWYAILPAGAVSGDSSILEPVASEAWGDYYMLYRVP